MDVLVAQEDVAVMWAANVITRTIFERHRINFKVNSMSFILKTNIIG